MRLLLGLLLPLCTTLAPRSGTPPQAGASPQASPQAAAAKNADALRKALAEHSIWLEPELGACAIPARVLVRADPLEYVLVNQAGNAHESLLATDTQPSELNVALLALGVQPGRNASWTPRDPPPTRDEMLAGAQAYDVQVPEGDGFLMYLAWKENGELFFFRLEDLIRNLQSGRSLRRHSWVYLGSRSVPSREDPKRELYVADLEGNLINLCFFEQGNTLLTGSLPECLQQTIWVGNSSLVPPSGEPVLFVFSRKVLDCCPEALRARVPTILADGR